MANWNCIDFLVELGFVSKKMEWLELREFLNFQVTNDWNIYDERVE